MKQISFKRLEEILQTVNPNTVKLINIELSSSCSSDMPFWADVNIGYNNYRILLGDMDTRYWEDGIKYFFNIIRNCGLDYKCNDYKQYCCSSFRIWKV